MASSSTVSCNCKNTCNRTSKRGACPCRSAGRSCTVICSCGWCLPCTNREASIRPDLDLPVSNFEGENEDLLDNYLAREEPESEANWLPPPVPSTQKRKREKASSDETQPDTVRRRLISTSDSQENTVTCTPARKKTARKTSTPRPSKSDPKPTNPATKQRKAIESFAAGLEESSLRKIVVELLSRDTGAFEDYKLGYMPQEPESPPPSSESPAWCKCGNCRSMGTRAEERCCMVRGSTCCATEAVHFYLVVDPAVLDLAIKHYNDFMVHDQVRDNAAYRHFAYRQFVLQRFGRLGAGNRQVVPSCVVLAIRDRFPDPNGSYTGFIDV